MNRNIVIKKSKIDKKGVFALRDFKKGEIVLKWNPRILKKAEIDKLREGQKNYIHRAGKNKYYLMRSPEKFVNHSCDANTRVIKHSDVAVRNIKKGEEITSDYGKSGIITFKCMCGSKNCKGKI